MTPRSRSVSDHPVSAVIVTEGLTKVFGGRGGEVRAVNSLDLEVARGEIFGLLGPKIGRAHV